MGCIKEVEYVNNIRPITSTSATPLICECSDGCHYYTKFCEGSEGPRELVNEFLGFEIAKLLKLPIPSAALVKINFDFEATVSNEIKMISSSNKYAFGSKALSKSNSLIHDIFIRNCQNKNDLLPIIVFDHIIGNSDREYNTGNILYRSSDRVIFIIDHGRILDVGTLWNRYSCEQRINEEIIIKDLSAKSIYGRIIDNVNLFEHKQECIDRFAKVKKEDIYNIFYSIPSEWNCTDEDKKAGAEYIWSRFQKYNYVIDEILKVKR